MAIRTRISTDKHEISYNHYHNGMFVETSYEPNFYTYFNQFSDVIGSKGLVHPADHRKVGVSYYPYPSYQTSTGTESYSPGTVIPPDTNVVYNLTPTLVGTTPYQSAVDAAFNSIALQIPTEVSVGNFILELNEVRDLIPRLTGALVKDASGLFLNWNFGWKPFVSDLKKLYNITTTVQSRLEYLRSTYGREVRASYYQDITLPSTVPSEYVIVLAPGYNIRYRRVSYRGIFRASGYVYQKLEDLSNAIGFCRGLIGALGLTNPTRVLWNAIPYSFVVDWILGLGSLLDRLNMQPFNGEWNVNRVTCSFRAHGQVEMIREFLLGTGSNQPVKLADVSVDQYVRQVGLPVSPGFWLSPNVPTAQQLLLGTALIVQRL